MQGCWANTYSQCEGKLSREHLVSSGIFAQKHLFVQGFQWCKKDEKRISVASITSKVLCEKHNSSLSAVDQAGIDAVRTIEALLPSHLRSVSSQASTGCIDGHMFEKWLLKTALNISFKSQYHIGFGMSGSESGRPSAYLQAVAFGDLQFTNRMGLHFLFPKGQYRFRVGSFHLFPIIKKQTIGGFVFHIRGMDFLLNLCPGFRPPTLRSLGINSATGDHDHILDANIVYRSSSVIVTDQSSEQQSLRIRW